jgi:hypothetical protein
MKLFLNMSSVCARIQRSIIFRSCLEEMKCALYYCKCGNPCVKWHITDLMWNWRPVVCLFWLCTGHEHRLSRWGWEAYCREGDLWLVVKSVMLQHGWKSSVLHHETSVMKRTRVRGFRTICSLNVCLVKDILLKVSYPYIVTKLMVLECVIKECH